MSYRSPHKPSTPLVFLISLFVCVHAGCGWTENQFGVVGYSDTEILPWCGYHKHDSYRPLPPYVEGRCVTLEPPADAVVLFDGTSLAAWKDSNWKLEDGLLIAGKGDIETAQAFGNCQLHVEFRTPATPAEELGDRGNSGVFLMTLYEIQVFDSHPMHETQLYPDGQCAAIYGETPPTWNASAKPGEWQSFDIVFKAPVFQNGELLSPARVTVVHNGVLVHHDEVIRGPTTHKKILTYRVHAAQLPLQLQGHGSNVAYRNIWLRPLD